MERTSLKISNYLPVADNCREHSSSSPLNSVESTATTASSRSRRKLAEWNVPAKSALLDLMEVHTHLERYESECENIMAYKGAAKGSDARQLRMHTQREGDAQVNDDDDDSDFCAEFTTPSRTSSCLLSGAVSIQPSAPLPEADFDSHGLGFFRDVGVDYLTLSKGSPIRTGTRVEKIEESGNEGGLPWDC